MSVSVIIDPIADKPRLDRLRGLARGSGMRLEKARGGQHLNNRGGLQLVDTSRNTVLDGADYGLTLDQAEHWIQHYRLARPR